MVGPRGARHRGPPDILRRVGTRGPGCRPHFPCATSAIWACARRSAIGERITGDREAQAPGGTSTPRASRRRRDALTPLRPQPAATGGPRVRRPLRHPLHDRRGRCAPGVRVAPPPGPAGRGRLARHRRPRPGLRRAPGRHGAGVPGPSRLRPSRGRGPRPDPRRRVVGALPFRGRQPRHRRSARPDHAHGPDHGGEPRHLGAEARTVLALLGGGGDPLPGAQLAAVQHRPGRARPPAGLVRGSAGGGGFRAVRPVPAHAAVPQGPRRALARPLRQPRRAGPRLAPRPGAPAPGAGHVRRPRALPVLRPRGRRDRPLPLLRHPLPVVHQTRVLAPLHLGPASGAGPGRRREAGVLPVPGVRRPARRSPRAHGGAAGRGRRVLPDHSAAGRVRGAGPGGLASAPVSPCATPWPPGPKCPWPGRR